MRLRALRLQSIFTYFTRPRHEEEEVPGHLEEGEKQGYFRDILPFLDVAFAPSPSSCACMSTSCLGGVIVTVSNRFCWWGWGWRVRHDTGGLGLHLLAGWHARDGAAGH